MVVGGWCFCFGVGGWFRVGVSGGVDLVGWGEWVVLLLWGEWWVGGVVVVGWVVVAYFLLTPSMTAMLEKRWWCSVAVID